MSVRLSVCPSHAITYRPCPCPCPPKKSLKLKTLLRKVIRYTIRVTKIHPESCCRCRRHCCRCCMPRLRCHCRRSSAAATKTTAFLDEAKPSYVYSTQFRVSSPLQSRSKAVVCASTPRKYPRSGYLLVITVLIYSVDFYQKSHTVKVVM